jgi:hypothetical protein
MRNWKLAAAATVTSGLLAGGMFAAFSFVARADTPAGNCNGTDSPLACTEDDTIPGPATVTLVITTDPGAVPVAVQWTALCTDSTGTTATYSKTGLSVTTPAGTGSESVDSAVALSSTTATSCEIQATATAAADANPPSGVPTPSATPVTSLNLAIQYTSNGLATATATATATTASPTPTASKTTTAPKLYNNQVHGFDGMCMNDKGNSSAKRTKVIVWQCNNKNPAQGWTFSNSKLKIHGMCLNAKGNGKQNSPLILWTCNGSGNEIFTHKANGEFVEKANGGTLCLNDPGFSTKNGTQLIVYKCKNTANEHWTKP